MMRGKIFRGAISWIVTVVSIPVVWIIIIKLKQYPNFILPPPEMVVDAVFSYASEFWFQSRSTLMTALRGYAWSNAIAITLAICFLYFPAIEGLVKRWVMIITMIPFVVIASIFAITFRDPGTPKVIIVVFITLYPLLVNLTKGLRAVEPVLLDRMKIQNANRWQVFWYVRWPAALPYFIASHEIAFPGSIIGAIVAEYFFSREGLGFYIIRAQQQYRTDKLFAVALIGLVMELTMLTIVNLVEWRIKWRKAR